MTVPARFADLERRTGLLDAAGYLDRHLPAAADPQRAAELAPEVLEASAPALLERWTSHGEQATRIAVALCGAAPFLAPHLIRHPEWLACLVADDLEQPRGREAFAERLAGAVHGVADAGIAGALRAFKYYELGRLTLRDLWADADDPSSTEAVLAELAHLADVLLDRAWRCALARVGCRQGPPRWAGPDGATVTPRFVVLGLGKLGGEELNYSSDVDLIYVLEELPCAAGPAGLSPAEYFGRAAREFSRLVSQPTPHGFLYRIDLDLRPEGQSGPLVVPSSMLAEYYDAWAATWEKAAFMKARPVAGDERFGWQLIRSLDPMIYRSSMDYAAVEAIRAMKDRIEHEAERRDATFNVKVGTGGIRDVEFVAQALQLLHGGRIPQVRGRSTQRALIALAQVGVLPAGQVDDLRRAYAFLRRAENRLQMVGERQTHRLPDEVADLHHLARALGYLGETPEAFAAALAAHRRRIGEIFTSLFSADGTVRVLDLFQRNAPQLLAQPATRTQIEELAARFARAIAASPDAERATNNLDRFIRGVGARRFYYGLLLDRPELVERLAGLFAASEYLSGYLATHPRLIEPIFSDPTVLVLGPPELQEALARIRADLAGADGSDEPELDLAALRQFHNRELVNVGLLDLAEKVSLRQVETGLTDLAEACIDAALALARRELGKRAALPPAAAQGAFLVVGMGKLASRELTYGSDLDVIFLYDVPGRDEAALLEAQEYYVRLAQKLIWALQTVTQDGSCYQIDARLRPSGNQGLLVSALASYARYHAAGAQVWERQALLRARPIAGDRALAAAFEALRREILAQPLPEQAAAEIRHVRQRMEAELAREGGPRRDFKLGRGGLLDIESVVQFLQLRHGATQPTLLDVEPIAVQLARLGGLGLLADTAILQAGWTFLQRLSSRLRIIENRSISDLDEERGDLEGVARRLGYTSPGRAGGARRALLEDYRRHTTAIRAIYDRVLGPPAA